MEILEDPYNALISALVQAAKALTRADDVTFNASIVTSYPAQQTHALPKSESGHTERGGKESHRAIGASGVTLDGKELVSSVDLVHSLVSIPIYAGSELFGVLTATSAQEHFFTERLCQALEKLCRPFEHILANLQQLQRTAQLRETLHDFGAPIASLAGFIELSQRELQDGQTHRVEEWLTLATASLQQLRYLNDLARDLSGYTQHSIPHTRAHVFLDHLAADVVAMLQPLASSQSVHLELQQHGHDFIVIGDEHQLHRAITNLVHNALQHSVQGSTVRLSIQPNGRHGVMLAVEDDGYGFSEQFFTQLGRDSNQLVRQHIRDQSLGLGLMIVRQIVLAHGGMLTIRNRASGGASLLVTLPRAESDLLPSCA